MSHHGRQRRACIIVPTLADGIHACPIQLETHEDIIVPSQPLVGTTGHLLGDQGTTPFITILGALLLILAHMESI